MPDIPKLLQSLGLGEHAEGFREQGVDWEVLATLNDADLRELGIRQLGQRRKLLNAVATFQATSDREPPQGPGPARVRLESGRRQLTIMFCDLVGSTALSREMDPENYKGLLQSYHQLVADEVSAFEGYVAQYLGDGVLVYFGVPRAHEDDASRAVTAALRIVAAMSRCGGTGRCLETRIGIATGLVVVGDLEERHGVAEFTASGETPNLAARLQGCSAPGQILVSLATAELLGTGFELLDAGPFPLTGFDAQVLARRVVGEREPQSRFQAAHGTELVPFVGRESEVALLLDRWSSSCASEGQVVLLTGEPGIGKSRVCQEFLQRLQGTPHDTLFLQCSAYSQNTPLYALWPYLRAASGLLDTDSESALIRKLLAVWPTVKTESAERLAKALATPTKASDAESPKQQRLKLMESVLDLLGQLATRRPLLIHVEDAHWVDPTTDELLGLVAARLRDASLMLLITARPQYAPAWSDPTQLTRLSLNRLGRSQCTAIIFAVAQGRVIPPDVTAEIILKTDGVPLFVEELTKTVMQSGLLKRGHLLAEPLPSTAIPSTLQDSLMARLDRLGPSKAVAQAGAVIGREFSYGLLRKVLEVQDVALESGLRDLVEAELLFRQGADEDSTFSFKHALVRDTAYNSMLNSQRISCHRAVASAIEECEPSVAATQPELVAYHWERAGENSNAVSCWVRAGDRAMQRSASREAASHYRSALRLVTLDSQATASDSLELDLQIKCANALTLSEGLYSEDSTSCFARAKELAIATGRFDRYVEACQWAYFTGQHFNEVLQRLEDLESKAPSLSVMVRVSRCAFMGTSAAHLALWDKASKYLAVARDLMHQVRPEEETLIAGALPAMTILTYSAKARHVQGCLDQAAALLQEALAVADERGHVLSRVWALQALANFELANGRAESAKDRTQLSISLAEGAGMRLKTAIGRFTLARYQLAWGDREDGRGMLIDSFAALKSAGIALQATEFACIAADTLLAAGLPDDARAFVTHSEHAQETTEERYYRAETYRLRGRICEIDGDGAGATENYRSALAVAEEQGALLFLLRAARDNLASRLVPSPLNERRQRLQAILDRFVEGHAFPDLVASKVLLE